MIGKNNPFNLYLGLDIHKLVTTIYSDAWQAAADTSKLHPILL